MERHLIEKAYHCAKVNFKKSYFTFKDLYNILVKEEPSIKNCSADLYIEILQDIRFISLGKQKWALRENFTVNEINKITSSMFGLDEYHEEDADQYMSDVEKYELKSKIEKIDDDLIIDDTEDDDNIKKPNMRKIGSDDEEDEIEKTNSIYSIRSNSEIDDDSDDIDSDEDDDSLVGVDDEESEENEDDDSLDDNDE